jgi:hypothetical protein
VSYYWYFSFWFRLRRYTYIKCYGVMWLYWQLGQSVSFVVVIEDTYLYVVVGYLMRLLFLYMWRYPNCGVYRLPFLLLVCEVGFVAWRRKGCEPTGTRWICTFARSSLVTEETEEKEFVLSCRRRSHIPEEQSVLLSLPH